MGSKERRLQKGLAMSRSFFEKIGISKKRSTSVLLEEFSWLWAASSSWKAEVVFPVVPMEDVFFLGRLLRIGTTTKYWVHAVSDQGDEKVITIVPCEDAVEAFRQCMEKGWGGWTIAHIAWGSEKHGPLSLTRPKAGVNIVQMLFSDDLRRLVSQ